MKKVRLVKNAPGYWGSAIPCVSLSQASRLKARIEAIDIESSTLHVRIGCRLF